MARAALFIGVNKAGDLPQLRDAAASATRLHKEWAKEQGLGPSKLITDEKKPVTADAIQKAIVKILEPGNVEQLFVYFAGHGVNVRMGEYWLLSDAPRLTQAAVNVQGSERLARFCGVPHVVMISDACRTAADTINAQNIQGTDIFPNEQVTTKNKPVDLFYSSALGQPSHEVRSAEQAARGFKAIYTAVLEDALRFKVPGIVEWDKDIGYIRPQALKSYLDDAVSERLLQLKLQRTVIQEPDAEIASDAKAWISRHKGRLAAAGALAMEGGARPGGQRKAAMRARAKPVKAPAMSPRAITRNVLKMAMENPLLVEGLLSPVPAAGPQHFETQCGFKMRGARIQEGFIVGGDLECLGPSREIVRVNGAVKRKPAPTVLLVLDSGFGIALPAIAEFIGSVTVDGQELIDVAWEPSDNTQRGAIFQGQSREARLLHRAVAAAGRTGTFRLEGPEAKELARSMQMLKGNDPALAVYAAYAYNQLHLDDWLKEMSRYMSHDLGAALFDVAMLAGTLDRKPLAKRPDVLGFAPLLSQGWAYLRARGIALPEDAERLPEMLGNSLWTIYTADGVSLLKSTVFKGAKPWRLV